MFTCQVGRDIIDLWRDVCNVGPVKVFGNGTEDGHVGLNGAGVETILAGQTLNVSTQKLCSHRIQWREGYIRNTGNALFVENVGSEVIVPKIEGLNVDAILDSCTELHTIIALGIWVVGDARRGIDGRLIHQSHRLLELAIQDIHADLECDRKPELDGRGQSASELDHEAQRQQIPSNYIASGECCIVSETYLGHGRKGCVKAIKLIVFSLHYAESCCARGNGKTATD